MVNLFTPVFPKANVLIKIIINTRAGIKLKGGKHAIGERNGIPISNVHMVTMYMKRTLICEMIVKMINCASFSKFFLGEELLVDLSKADTKQYMITRGAPEMENIMVCFSSRSLTKDKPQTYFSYSTTSYQQKDGEWEATVKTEFKISSNENGHFLVSKDKSTE